MCAKYFVGFAQYFVGFAQQMALKNIFVDQLSTKVKVSVFTPTKGWVYWPIGHFSVFDNMYIMCFYNILPVVTILFKKLQDFANTSYKLLISFLLFVTYPIRKADSLNIEHSQIHCSLSFCSMCKLNSLIAKWRRRNEPPDICYFLNFDHGCEWGNKMDNVYHVHC